MMHKINEIMRSLIGIKRSSNTMPIEKSPKTKFDKLFDEKGNLIDMTSEQWQRFDEKGNWIGRVQ